MKKLILATLLICPSITHASSVRDAALATHNQLRARHHAPPLTWDKTLESYALNYANQCQFKHSGSPYGENLARGYPTAAIAIIHGWYDEGEHYSYNNPGFTMRTGHFTQLVWKATTRVGCGMVDCNGKNGLHGKFLVCEYSPPGNVTNPGFFRANVLPVN